MPLITLITLIHQAGPRSTISQRLTSCNAQNALPRIREHTLSEPTVYALPYNAVPENYLGRDSPLRAAQLIGPDRAELVLCPIGRSLLAIPPWHGGTRDGPMEQGCFRRATALIF